MLQPFRIDVQQAKLEEIYEGVRRYPWSKLQQPAYADDWRYCPPADFARSLCDYWTTAYD
jgi:Epoxide hydrolase N terminus